jgi:hypothetical protein
VRLTGNADLDAMGLLGGLHVVNCISCGCAVTRNGHVQRHNGPRWLNRQACDACDTDTGTPAWVRLNISLVLK